MLEYLKNNISKKELLSGGYGIEREGLRVNGDGTLALTKHPKVFGKKICNPYITTDFSESQLELITPAFSNVKETYEFLNALYDIVALEMGEEYIWPQSMPNILPEDKDIPIAEFCECPMGKNARRYREVLYKKYGGKKQLISGIHYNFSFSEDLIKNLYKGLGADEDYKTFKSNMYLKVVRNYSRYRWLVIYLLCGSSLVHESFDIVKESTDYEINKGTFSNNKAISYRNGKWGYKNNIDLFPNYDSVEAYVDSIKYFIQKGYIENHKELYSQIRLKAHNVEDFLQSLLDNGINYLEYRSIDVNPFEKGGISLEDLEFLQIFNIFLLLKEESNYDKWQEEALENQIAISNYGLDNVILKRNGEEISKENWALQLLDEIKDINDRLALGFEEVIDSITNKIKDSKLTYAYKLKELVAQKGFVEAHVELAKGYKNSAYNNRFKLEGYEDLELSTQILMKEAIKRGIKTKIIDRSENFISLDKCDKKEYVKQATKTSKDNYVTVLIMENKLATKKVLIEENIKVPAGKEFYSIEDALIGSKEYEFKPIVIKPKSTNFGIGISIFPEGANLEDMEKAFKIAFENDNTVLLEEFIKGKEYRFLVIDDEVVGILHRVPANVKGDGERSIKELVAIKNTDPLRGKGYRTPLEKINLDRNAELFLKQRGLNFEYVPNKDEIVYLRENSNISTGGDSIDYTDDIPDRFKEIAINATKAVRARVCGVDMMLEDYKDENSEYSIIELNFNPAIHIHSYPYIGKERKVAEKVLKLLELI